VAPLRGGLDKPGPSAKRNNAFCFFFWKKKTIHQLLVLCEAGDDISIPRFPRSGSIQGVGEKKAVSRVIVVMVGHDVFVQLDADGRGS
jgi:hypothetical protein